MYLSRDDVCMSMYIQYVGMYVCVWGCMYVGGDVCMYVCGLYVHRGVGVYVCVWGCVHVCVTVYIYAHVGERKPGARKETGSAKGNQ